MQFRKGFNYVLYHRWEYTAEADEKTIVRPDGCRDVLFISQPGKPAEIRVTDWDNLPYAVHSRAGTSFIGYRLRPGTTISPKVFENEEADISTLVSIIESETAQNQEVCEIIDALTKPNVTVTELARKNGTTTRTLQRHFHNLSLPNPDFWRLLGRARRAARALSVSAPLNEIAYSHGYSDQAHMTREFVRWFGCSPAQLRENRGAIDDICQPGLGCWLDDSHSEIGSLF